MLMRRPRLHTLAALGLISCVLLGSVPVDARTSEQIFPRPTPFPTPTRPVFTPAQPTITPTAAPATPVVPPQPPVVNNDPRFGVVQAIFNPQLALNMGARWERLIFPWNQIQPNGPADFEQGWFSEDQLNSELARGVQVVGITLYTPAWAARDPQYEGRSVPRNLELSIDHPQNYWSQYIKRLVAKYRGRIDTWVILNEPDIYRDPDDFRTFAGTPADYAQVLRVAYLAAKSVNPNAQIVMSGFTYFWDRENRRPQYFGRVLDALARDPAAPANNWYFDAIDVHTYGNPLNAFTIPTVMKRLMRDKRIDKPVWIVESNVLPKDDPLAPPQDVSFRATMDEQASYVIQNMALALAAGVQRIAMYKMTDEEAELSDQYWGLARNDGSVRPAYVAYQTAIRYFQQTRAATYYWWGANVPLQEPEVSNLLVSNENRFQWPWPAAVNVVVLDKGPQRLTVIWNASPEPGQVQLPAYGRNAQLVDKYGRAVPLAAQNGYYPLTLEPSRNNSDPRDRSLYLVGGSPWIVVEDVSQPLTPMPTLTFTATPIPSATLTPSPTGSPTFGPSPTFNPATPTPTPPPTSTRAPTWTPSVLPAAPATATPQPTVTLTAAPSPSVPPAAPTLMPLPPSIPPDVQPSHGAPPDLEPPAPPPEPSE